MEYSSSVPEGRVVYHGLVLAPGNLHLELLRGTKKAGLPPYWRRLTRLIFSTYQIIYFSTLLSPG